MLQFLNELQRNKLKKYLVEFPDNFGQVKGGKRAYALNRTNFDNGRKKAAISNKIKRKKNFNFDVKLDEDICEYIGAFIGDGFFNCYSNKLYQVEYSGDSRYDLNYYEKVIIPKIKRVVKTCNPRIYKVKNKNAIRVVFYSKEFFCFLRDYLDFKPGVKTYSVIIPNKIINSEEKLINATIRGIFDTDGGVYLDERKRYRNPYPRIIFQTASENLYDQLVHYLSKDFRIFSKYNKARKIYIIEIYGKDQLKKWMSIIGFSNKKHLDKIATVA